MRTSVLESLFGKVTCCRSATSLETRPQQRSFFCEFCELCKNTFFAEHHGTTASDYRGNKGKRFLECFLSVSCVNQKKNGKEKQEEFQSVYLTKAAACTQNNVKCYIPHEESRLG